MLNIKKLRNLILNYNDDWINSLFKSYDDDKIPQGKLESCKGNINEIIDNKILAQFDEHTIKVYQAYNTKIADEAVRLGAFGQQFITDYVNNVSEPIWYNWLKYKFKI